MTYYTAPSFTNFEKVSEPYEKNKKMYIDVKHPNTGNVRSVRLYDEREYHKAYGGTVGSASAETTKPQSRVGTVDLKKARGFSNGPITLIKTKDEDFLKRSNARYACDISWYFVSTEPIPQDLPEDASLSELTWEGFCGL